MKYLEIEDEAELEEEEKDTEKEETLEENSLRMTFIW